MNKFWLLVILVFFIQEPASTDAIIFQARHLGLNLFIFNSVWLLVTSIDIWLGYLIGKKVQEKYKNTRFEKFSRKWADRVENFVGKKGEKIALVFLGFINFPYLNSFLASWLNISFKNMFYPILIGDGIYWVTAWAINIGIRGFFTNSHTALYVIIAIGLLFSIFSKIIFDKVVARK